MEKEAENKLVNEVDKYSSDDEVIALYSAYSRDELEWNTLKIEAREEGLKEGSKQEKLEIAKKLLKMNMSISDISKATGLTKEQIENLY